MSTIPKHHHILSRASGRTALLAHKQSQRTRSLSASHAASVTAGWDSLPVLGCAPPPGSQAAAIAASAIAAGLPSNAVGFVPPVSSSSSSSSSNNNTSNNNSSGSYRSIAPSPPSSLGHAAQTAAHHSSSHAHARALHFWAQAPSARPGPGPVPGPSSSASNANNGTSHGASGSFMDPSVIRPSDKASIASVDSTSPTNPFLHGATGSGFDGNDPVFSFDAGISSGSGGASSNPFSFFGGGSSASSRLSLSPPVSARYQGPPPPPPFDAAITLPAGNPHGSTGAESFGSLLPSASSTASTSDSSSSSSSGSSTPTSQSNGNSSLPTQPPFSSSAALTAASASSALVLSRSSSAAPWGVPAHWARAFSIPRSRRTSYMFEHGAYGIPKRHPLAALPPTGTASGGRTSRQPKSAPRGSRGGLFAAAADFLAGPQTAPDQNTSALEAPILGPEAARRGTRRPVDGPGAGQHNGTLTGQPRIRGPSIRQNGKIVQDRLRSVSVGEDAYFLRPDSLGVADGVGGWASRPGADPALFSRLLMHFCAVELARFDGMEASDLAADGAKLLSAWESIDPVEVMHRAWERCVRASRREGILGSSTALLAVLRGDELRIANLGDCVLLIIRSGDLLFRSAEQQHSFNFPVQLGMMGSTTESIKAAAERVAAENAKRASQEDASQTSSVVKEGDEFDDDTVDDPRTGSSLATPAAPASSASSSASSMKPAEWDEPRRDAGRWTVKVQRGDIIIIGSDGLVDNLFDEDILEEVLRFAPAPAVDEYEGSYAEGEGAEGEEAGLGMGMGGGTTLPPDFSPQLVSEALCSRAKAVSEDSRAVASPFQQRAMEEGLHYVGGKHDDISVLVAVIGERDGSAEWDAAEVGSASVGVGEGAGVGSPSSSSNVSASTAPSDESSPASSVASLKTNGDSSQPGVVA